jgi:hypothetical protein
VATVHESTIRELTPPPNGATKVFFTPTTYKAGTLRLIWNGQVYEPDDDRFGWTELTNQTIETTGTPRTNDVLQAFYQDEGGSGIPDVDNVVGSPFHPFGVLP